ncbi:PepSY domain-containing protein [Bosea sp. (in: a-proteobacteria)]|uniref:PepSY domain-containing protein n=1 Tax=Bosea sp. (in: a-proteobacteria) TaxID=1871050 RepID=UPI002FC85E45
MPMTLLDPTTAILAMLTLAASPVAPADTSQPISCLSASETREAVSDGKVMQPAAASRHAREAAPGEVLRIRLCRLGDDYVYVVTTMKRDGRVARVTLDGHSGKVADIR